MSSDTYTIPQTAKQVIDAIANYCGRADHNGSDWKCKCPICGRHSLSLTHGQKIPILIRCWHCADNGINDGFTEQCKIFVEAGLLPSSQRTIKKVSPKEWRKYQQEKREAAVRLWSRLFPIKPEYPTGKYLKARGLESFISHPALRCAAAAIHPTGHPLPILAARVFHVEHGICAVQYTYLNWDGSDRDRELEPGRQTFGALKGGAVWIGAPMPNKEVVVAEGLETLLSAMLLLNLRCGAAVLGARTHMQELVLPSGVRKLHIAADNDETGRSSADCTATLWRNRGLSVRVSYPEIVGKDFNDVLMGKMA
jgi:Toprim domain